MSAHLSTCIPTRTCTHRSTHLCVCRHTQLRTYLQTRLQTCPQTCLHTCHAYTHIIDACLHTCPCPRLPIRRGLVDSGSTAPLYRLYIGSASAIADGSSIARVETCRYSKRPPRPRAFQQCIAHAQRRCPYPRLRIRLRLVQSPELAEDHLGVVLERLRTHGQACASTCMQTGV